MNCVMTTIRKRSSTVWRIMDRYKTVGGWASIQVSYRERIRQGDAVGEYALSRELRGIILHEQEHLIDLADAPGIQAPEVE
jgi:hypothetical protein